MSHFECDQPGNHRAPMHLGPGCGWPGCEHCDGGLRAEPKSQEEDVLSLLHSLWGKAVGTPTYDKKQWSKLEQEVRRLLR